MLGPVTVLTTLERYYDAAPRPQATTEEVGPFTLFVRTDPEGWPYYARPRLDETHDITVEDVHAVRARQRALGVTEAIEWVHESTPGLLAAARGAGLHVDECPLLVLPADAVPAGGGVADDVRVELLEADAPTIADVVAAVSAGFAGTDDVEPRGPGRWPTLLAAGLTRMAGAYDDEGAVGGGTHQPRGEATELTGIAVLPRARRRGVGAALTAALVRDARDLGVETIFLSAQDDAVARVYERVGFVRVGTACVAEAAGG